MGFIYRITNIENGKVYIGQTGLEDPLLRWKLHIKSIAYGKGCPALANAVKHYGISKFKFEVLIICFDEDRFKFEREYIKKYSSRVPNGYNITEGGEGGGGFKGKTHTDESRHKISETFKSIYANPVRNQIYNNEKTKEKRIETLKRLCSNPELKAKRSEAMKKYRMNHIVTLSEKTKAQISTTLKEYFKDEREKGTTAVLTNNIFTAKSRKVAQYTLDTHTHISSFPSIRQATIATGIGNGSIHAVLSGKCKHAGGYYWEYVNE